MRFSTIQNSFFFGTLAFASILFLWLLNDFIFPIIWAVILGMLFYPAYERILTYVKNKSAIASTLTILLLLIVIFSPLYYMTTVVAQEAISVYKDFTISENVNTESKLQTAINKTTLSLSKIGIDPYEARIKISSTAQTVISKIGIEALNFGKQTLNTIIQFFLMLYILFFVFKDGKYFAKRLSEILPLGDKKELRLFNKFNSIVRAIFKGTIVVALVQGLLGGLLFYIVGIESVSLWTVVMIILAVIPAVGPTIILIPAGIFMLATSNIGPALILILGAVFISLIDNILRPLLIGNDIKMHDLFITLSMFGGLALFGVTGFIIGPVIAGLFITLWEIFEEEYEKELKTRG